MNNKMKRVGPISVYLTREQVNALLYLLDCFPAADRGKSSTESDRAENDAILHHFFFRWLYAGAKKESEIYSDMEERCRA